MTILHRPAHRPTWIQALTASLTSALETPWVAAIVRISAIDDTLAAIHPLLSLTTIRARVLRVIDQTPNTKTFVLRPNALWTGARAGQYVRVQVEINGRLQRRIYSLSSRPGAKYLAITVKRDAGGLVSNYLHDHMRVGDVITLSEAGGEFVLPAELPKKILLLSAGSGITPVMAMLRDLHARAYAGEVVFLHACRDADDLIFAEELRSGVALAGLRVMIHCTASTGRLDAATLETLVPDLDTRATWLCGPAPMMNWVHQLWDAEKYGSPLHSERYTAAPIRVAAHASAPVAVTFAASGRQFTTAGGDPLLLQAERAGLAPKYGCRIGICRTCQCVKTSGTVENLQTGEISSTPNELIRLCISAARSDLALDL